MGKIKVGIYGIDHNHCAAKVMEMRSMNDLFEIVVYMLKMRSKKKTWVR